jgi:hypothetical protein
MQSVRVSREVDEPVGAEGNGIRRASKGDSQADARADDHCRRSGRRKPPALQPEPRHALGRRSWRRECRIVREDSQFELLQRAAGLKPELLRESVPAAQYGSSARAC